MASKYKSFSNKQFLFEMRAILERNSMYPVVKDVTEEFSNTWEHVYSVATKNRAVDIIIYSSVDLATHHTREVGSDAVRVVMRWKLKSGRQGFKKLHKHYRIETLFENLEQTIVGNASNVFSLQFGEFCWEGEKELV